MATETGILIRPATPADVPGLAHVHIATWRTTYRGIVPDAHLDAMDTDHHMAGWSRMLGTRRHGWFVLVATDAGRIVGFATGGPVRTDDPGYTGELGGIYVLTSHQRRGIGRRLVTEVVRGLRVKGMASMLVWALRDNPFRAFYEALGGEFVREQTITIGGADLVEVAYGWRDTRTLL